MGPFEALFERPVLEQMETTFQMPILANLLCEVEVGFSFLFSLGILSIFVYFLWIFGAYLFFLGPDTVGLEFFDKEAQST